jgi:acyl carrier protein
MKVKIEDLKAELKKSFNGDVNVIAPDQVLSDSVDSLDLMDFYMNIEEKYDVSIPDKEVESLKSLNHFKNYLEEKLK